MRIEVRELEVGSVVRTPFEEHVASDSNEVTLNAPVVGEVEVARTARAVLLKVRVATTVVLVCGRCLEPLQHRLDVAFSEEFATDLSLRPVLRGSPEADDSAAVLGPASELNVSELIRQHLLLAAPMVPLCMPTCRGLCPQCGANWNHETCTCTQETIDPRLAPLQQFGKGKATTDNPKRTT